MSKLFPIKIIKIHGKIKKQCEYLENLDIYGEGESIFVSFTIEVSSLFLGTKARILINKKITAWI